MGEEWMANEGKMVKLTLPWPPSVNRYWRRRGHRYFISNEGQDFRETVGLICMGLAGSFKINERLCVKIDAYPPDKRRRDLDNILKALFDSLQHALVYEDDNQIDEIHIVRKSSILGEISVTLTKKESRHPP